MRAPARVFSIPASAPFLPTLIEAIRDGRLGLGACRDPLELAQLTLFLPTRRACRLAQEAFLDALGGRAAVLPRIVAIGDIDEDEFIFATGAPHEIASEALTLPPAISGLERRMLLTRLVQEWARATGEAPSPVVASPAAAFALAGNLERLMDDFVTRQVPWDRLDRLVPEAHDRYWDMTLRFLKIARNVWPDILLSRGAIEPAARRERLIEAESARLSAMPDQTVIAAGSTGSMPVTAKLLATIARLPRGAVVLPGLDADLDEDSWSLIGGDGDHGAAVTHPQFSMRALLERIGIVRADVASLADTADHERNRLVCEALRPAASTDRWTICLSGDESWLDRAVSGLSVVEAPNPDGEALAIAVALRETLNVHGKTAALITPDRALARRVIAALQRWGLAVDDSAGVSLAQSRAGTFARLIAQTAFGGLAPVPLLALLKHPLCLSAEAGEGMAAIAILEQAVLRGPRPRPGTQGLAHALSTLRDLRPSLHRSDARAKLTDEELAQADALISRLAVALAPLESLTGAERLRLSELAQRHREVIIALGTDVCGRLPVFESDDGMALASTFEDIETLAEVGPTIASGDYLDLFTAILEQRVLSQAIAGGAAIRILGLLEARLHTADRVVLGGLVDGIWPPQPDTDPWLSRPMRTELGLDLPERRIGLSAHDFAQALGAKDVVLTRSLKREGAPTVASRFLQRLAAVAGEARWADARRRGRRYVDLSRELDAPEKIKSIAQPCPAPPRAMRPTALAVTDIEHWLRDPYTIYAKHILKLRPLDPIDEAPGAADRGTLVHGAVSAFTDRFTNAPPDDAVRELMEIGRQHFAPLQDFPEARAFWWPRFERIARWFCDWEAKRRPSLRATFSEIRGVLDIGAGERTFRLLARADRIDLLRDGRYAIIDYKTGQKRTEKQVSSGLAPQLTLEGAILRHGGFPGIAKGSSLAALAYVLLKGGEPAGQDYAIAFKDGTPDDHAERALRRLTDVVRRFEDESMPYRALVSPMWSKRYGEYDHLARVKEWSATGGTQAGDGSDS